MPLDVVPTDQPPASLQARVDAAHVDYERDGVAVIPAVFERAECDAIRGAAYMALTRLAEISRRGYTGRVLQTVDTPAGEFPSLLFFPALASSYLERVRTDPRLVQIVTAMLGPDVRQLNNQVYFRLPGDGDTFAWHQDVMFRQPRADYPGVESAYLQTIIVVDEIGRDNAPVEYILGSHREGELPLAGNEVVNLRRFERGELRGNVITAHPGDVLIWNALIVHGSEPNRASRPRMTYMNGFARADAARHWPHYLRAGQPQALDMGELPWSRRNCWRRMLGRVLPGY